MRPNAEKIKIDALKENRERKMRVNVCYGERAWREIEWISLVETVHIQIVGSNIL